MCPWTSSQLTKGDEGGGFFRRYGVGVCSGDVSNTAGMKRVSPDKK